MPISITDLNELVTKGDLLNFMNRMEGLLTATKDSISEQVQRAVKANHFRPKYLSPTQFSNCLAELPGGRRITPHTIRQWCRDGSLRASQGLGAGTTWLIPYEELERIHQDAMLNSPSRPR